MQSSWNTSLSISVSRNCLVNLYFSFFKKCFRDYSTCSEKVQRLRDQALPLHYRHGVLTTGPPGKSCSFFFLNKSFPSLPGRLLIYFIYK